MKAVDVELECEKNFGNVSENLLFKLEPNSKNDFMPIKAQIEGRIKEAESVYICSERGISKEIVSFLEENNLLRIYILVQKINESAYLNAPFKDRCIVREVPSLAGNYIITESKNGSILFLFDADFNGFALTESDAVHKIKQVFINEFWNHAKKEFVLELQDVAEKSFDIPNVKGDSTLVLNQGSEEKSPLQNVIDNVEELFLRENPEKFLNYPIKKLYLKKIPEKQILESFLKNGTEVFYSPEFDFDFIKTSSAVYAANFDISSDDWRDSRNGRLFLLKTNITKYVYGRLYKLNESLSWNECFGNDILDSSGKPYVVTERGSLQEVKTRPVDARIIKKNKHKLDNWEQYLAEQNSFEPNQRAILIPFKITIPVLKKTLSKKADVYAQFENANIAIPRYYAECIRELSSRISKLEADLNSTSKKLDDKENTLDKERTNREILDTKREETLRDFDRQINEVEQDKKVLSKNKEIDSIREKINEDEEKISELRKKKDDKKAAGSIVDFEKSIKKHEAELQKKEDEKSSIIKSLSQQLEKQKSKESEEFKKKLAKHDNQIDALQKEISKLESDKETLEKSLAKEKADKTKIENSSASFKRVETVQDFSAAKKLLEDTLSGIYSGKITLQTPEFDIPKFGELYQYKKHFEYIVLEEDDFENAEKEMLSFGIQDVTFVSA